MAARCPASLQVCAMRVSRLDATGVPDPGADNLYVSSALIRLVPTVVMRPGEDMELVSGCGEVCVSYKDRDKLKRFDMTMELCTPDPSLTEMLVGGETISDGNGDIIGWAAPHVGVDANPYGVAIEAWTKAITNGAQDPVYPWWRWVFPRTYWTIGDKNMENAPMTNPFSGYSEENVNFYDGPANDWPYTSDRCFQYALDTDVPTAACGYQTLAAS